MKSTNKKQRSIQLALGLLVVISASFLGQCLAQDQAPTEPTRAVRTQLKKALNTPKKLAVLAKKLLSPLEYKVAFESGTERAFKNRYWDNKASGLYVDLISGEPLFSSAHKFRSGTGWPSFDRALGKDVVEVVDTSHGAKRIEVRSKISDIHLGHVFEDGPRKTTGRRFCINSAAVRFVPLADLTKEGYADFIEEAGLKQVIKAKKKNK
ncbi:MAG: peptide-methionine (R)-S-oxide reductase [Myxococcales bacterium]|nr:peptide-methionine (R)-S-oxide reductase [Myxococcales bacterium]